MTGTKHTEQQVGRRIGAREAADGYAQRARDLVTRYLGQDFKIESTLEAIQKSAVEAIPQPRFGMNGLTVTGQSKKKDSDLALAGLESALDTRGVDADTVRDLMRDLRALSDEIIAARGKGVRRP